MPGEALIMTVVGGFIFGIMPGKSRLWWGMVYAVFVFITFLALPRNEFLVLFGVSFVAMLLGFVLCWLLFVRKSR
ncbi:MAG: hypothetical protein RL716_1033 [Actinomycetota bacterium]|jgi:chromate transport protein ChrA